MPTPDALRVRHTGRQRVPTDQHRRVQRHDRRAGDSVPPKKHNKANLVIGDTNNNNLKVSASTPTCALPPCASHPRFLTHHGALQMGVWNESGLWRRVLDLQHGRQVRPRPHTPASSAYLAHASLRIDARRHVPLQEVILTGSSAPFDGRHFAFMMYRTEVPTLRTVLAPHPALPAASASQHLWRRRRRALPLL